MLKGDISGLYGDDEVIIADGRLNAEYVSDAVSEAVPEMCTGCSLFSFMPEADAFCAESFIGNKSIREKARKITLRLCGMKPYRYAVLVRKDFFSGDLYSVFLFRDKKQRRTSSAPKNLPTVFPKRFLKAEPRQKKSTSPFVC